MISDNIGNKDISEIKYLNDTKISNISNRLQKVLTPKKIIQNLTFRSISLDHTKTSIIKKILKETAKLEDSYVTKLNEYLDLK